jgi:hypothetical protein
MVDIANIVDVTITKETQSVSQMGFGTPLILGPNGPGANYEVRLYESIDDVADDYAITDPEYLMALGVFSQSPRVKEVKIATLDAFVEMVQTIVFSTDLIIGNSVACVVDGVALTATPFDVSNAQTLTDLAAKIQATAGVGTSISDGFHTITNTAATAGKPFAITGVIVTGGVSQATAVVTTTVDNVDYASNLTEIVKTDNDWYGLLADTVDEVFVEAIAAWVESHYKIYFTRSEDVDIYDSGSTTDIAAVLDTAERERTAVIFNEDNDDYIDGCWMGKGLPYAPGSITYKFKTLSGPAASTTLTGTERQNILNKNCNLYSYIAGVNMMEEGTMASGEFIDIIIGIDYIRARMAENIFGKLVNAKKIPYTDAGIAIIEAEIRAVLENAIKIGIVARAPEEFEGKDYVVEAPKVADISDNDKANRLLPDVTWQARLAGAIHKVIVVGHVQV